jgi:oxaloacetate decarboxylase (Na+ extruding) subunit gamma
MNTELLRQGTELMLVGMGTVFVFLSLLVLCTTVMSRLVLRWQGVSATPPGEDDAEVAAAIVGAIAHHRRRR